MPNDTCAIKNNNNNHRISHHIYLHVGFTCENNAKLFSEDYEYHDICKSQQILITHFPLHCISLALSLHTLNCCGRNLATLCDDEFTLRQSESHCDKAEISYSVHRSAALFSTVMTI